MTGHTPDTHRRLLKQLSAYCPEDGHPEIVRLDYEGSDLYLYVTSKVERRSRVFSCRKEPWTVEWLERAVQPGDVVFDVGANVGAYSLIAARRVGPAGRVVAIEPSYATYARLCDNIVLNDVGAIVVPVPLPVGAMTGLATLNYHRLHPGQARHVAGAPSVDGKGQEPVYRQPVMLITLDDLVDRFGLPAPQMMKIDVDGAEVGVLEGAVRMLGHRELRGLLIEVDEENSAPVQALVSKAGFELSARHQRTRDDGTPASLWYGLFTRT